MQLKTKIVLALSCISLISQGMEHQLLFDANVFEENVTPPIFDAQPYQQQIIFSQLPETLPANVHIAIQSGIQEAMHENKALSYAIFMQHLKKSPLVVKYISFVMSPIIEMMADALNGGDIEKLIALKNTTVKVFANPELNAIVNDELQRRFDAIIESMVHIKHDKVVFSPSRHARRQMTWELNQYMKFHLTPNQYAAMVKKFMQNKVPHFDEIYEYNHASFISPHRWPQYVKDAFTPSYTGTQVVNHSDFKKLEKIWRLYKSGARTAARATVNNTNESHAALWLSLERQHNIQQARIAQEARYRKHQQLELEKKKQVEAELQINTPSKITHALQTSENKQALATSLNSTKDAVYANAQKYKYEIHSELKEQIQSSINGLALCNNPHEFIFHVATVNHSLTDIQIQTAHKAGIAPSLSQQACELFEHTIGKYCEYVIAPTENEVTLLVSLAQYISDTTAGTHYLTPEMREARIAQFWDSLSKLCDTTPAKLVDNCMYAAARATWAVGIVKAVQVIKNVALVAGHHAYQFMQNFDQVIGNNPAMITAEGAIVVPATQEATWGQSITRAIWGAPKNEINSVDGLMNFLESEKNINKDLAKEYNSDELAKILEVDNSKPIKNIREGSCNPDHIFSEEHKADGILFAGNKKEIMNRCLNEVKKINDMKKLVEGDNEIRLLMNRKAITIRVHIRNGIAMNINIFPNFSNRVLGKLFDLV